METRSFGYSAEVRQTLDELEQSILQQQVALSKLSDMILQRGALINEQAALISERAALIAKRQAIIDNLSGGVLRQEPEPRTPR